MKKWNSPLDPGTLLRRAAAEGDTDQVKNLLDENKNYINHSSSNGNTALHWSVLNQRYATTKLLLTHCDIDIEAKNKHGDTPLHLAVKLEDKKIVYRLIKAGVGKKNIINKQGFSPLDYAVDKNNSFIVTQLKRKFPNLLLKNEDKSAEEAYEKFKINHSNLLENSQIFDQSYFFNAGISPYFAPGNTFSLDDIKTAVEKRILDPHKLFCCGNLLQSAAVSRVDTLEKFSWLLSLGVDPNLQASHEINPSSYKNTALHTLIANEDEKDALAFIDLLVHSEKKQFNFNLRDSEGKTCLCLAVKVGLTEVAKKLIALKGQVDVNVPDEDGNTPLHYAFLLGHTSIAIELLANKADKHAKNKCIKNPYELLMSTDSEDVRDCLETIWINPDRKIKASKKTYSQLCMENREILINEFKAMTDISDSPVSNQEIFIVQKRKSVAFLIAAETGDLTNLQNTCDPIILNQVNAKGNTALHLACQHNHKKCVEFLLQQPGIDLYKPNNENIKAVDIVNSELLANLFEEKLQTFLVHKTEKSEGTISKPAYRP